MGLSARIIHTIGFEFFGLVIFTPFAMFVLNENLFHIGGLAIVISVMAMVWNLIYNYIYDTIELKLGRHRSQRGAVMRIFHAILFETGLLVATLPIVAYVLGMDIIEALLVDLGFVVFYVIYAFVYNYIFDKIYFNFFAK